MSQKTKTIAFLRNPGHTIRRFMKKILQYALTGLVFTGMISASAMAAAPAPLPPQPPQKQKPSHGTSIDGVVHIPPGATYTITETSTQIIVTVILPNHGGTDVYVYNKKSHKVKKGHKAWINPKSIA